MRIRRAGQTTQVDRLAGRSDGFQVLVGEGRDWRRAVYRVDRGDHRQGLQWAEPAGLREGTQRSGFPVTGLGKAGGQQLSLCGCSTTVGSAG